MNSTISKYIYLIKYFQSSRINAKQFETDFLRVFKNDKASIDYPEKVFDTLDSLFAAVDEYCGDPDLRLQLPRSLDENGLLAAADRAGERLRSLMN